jgi:hypothetical protein
MIKNENVRQVYSNWCRDGGGQVTNIPASCNALSLSIEVLGGEQLGGWLWRVTDDVADDPVVDVSEEVFASFAAAKEAALAHARAMEEYASAHLSCAPRS